MLTKLEKDKLNEALKGWYKIAKRRNTPLLYLVGEVIVAIIQQRKMDTKPMRNIEAITQFDRTMDTLTRRFGRMSVADHANYVPPRASCKYDWRRSLPDTDTLALEETPKKEAGVISTPSTTLPETDSYEEGRRRCKHGPVHHDKRSHCTVRPCLRLGFSRPIEAWCSIVIRVRSSCRCESLILVSNEWLLRGVCGVMKTHCSWSTLLPITKVPTSSDNNRCNSTDRCRLRVRGVNLNISDAFRTGICQHYFKTAHIRHDYDVTFGFSTDISDWLYRHLG